MFIAALFIIARTWKQPRRPSADERIRKLWYIYTMEYYSATEKNKIMTFTATGMDPEIIILSNKKSEETNTIYDLYAESKI